MGAIRPARLPRGPPASIASPPPDAAAGATWPALPRRPTLPPTRPSPPRRRSLPGRQARRGAWRTPSARWRWTRVEAANSGHPGMPMGMADVATVLFTKFLKFDAADPRWADRDRFVLSAGHGSMLLYALLHLTGYAGMAIDDICAASASSHSPAAGHPEYGEHPGIETTTGPLGQGLATAVGMAMAERHLAGALRRRPGRSPHLGDRRRRLPDGRRQPRGGVACRASAASSKLMRAVGRQPHLDRRRHRAVLHRRHAEALRRPMAGHAARATAMTPRRSPARWPAATRIAQAGADRLPHHHRLGRADQGGHARGRMARRWALPRSPRRKEALGWTQPPFDVPDDIKAAWQAAGRARRAARAGPG